MGLSISINDQAAFNVVIGVPGPTGPAGPTGPVGPAGPVGPVGPTFTGGAITSPIAYTVGTNTTVLENGDIYTENTATGAYGVVYINGLEASDGTHTLAMTASGITFGDSTFQSTAFPGSSAFYPSTGNPSGFLTAASLSGYATQSWVTSQGYATESYVNSQGFITASALTPYLLSSTAASTYYPLSNPSSYFSVGSGDLNLDGYAITDGNFNAPAGQVNAQNVTLTAGDGGVLTFSDGTTQGTAGLSKSAADGYYYPLVGNPNGYLTSAGAASTYQTIAGMSSYLTTSAASSTYLTQSNAASTYQTQAGMSSYLTVSAAASGYYPLSGNPSGFIGDAPSDSTTYGRNNGAWVAAASPFTGGDIPGPITMHDGTSDSEMSAAFFGVELSSDSYQFAELQYNSLTIGNTVGLMQITPAGITFPDSSVQTTAAVSGFVPGSGNLDMGGYDITNANFNSSAGQVSAQNITMSSGGVLTFGDSTVQTTAATGGGGLPVVQISASAINPAHLTFNPSPQCIALTYPTHTDVLNGTYATAFTYQNDAVGNPTFTLSGLTSLNIAYVNDNTSMTSVPDFTSCTALSTAYVYGNASITSAPSFSGLTSLTSANVYNNASMTSAPDFTGCTSLAIANVSDNASMTTAPSFSGLTSLNTAQVTGNTSMTSAPDFTGCTSLAIANVSGNTSMTSAPSFSGLTSLTNAYVYANTSMTTAPSFSGFTALTTAYVNGNTSMTTAPDFTGCTSLTGANVFNCAISDCTTILDQLDANGLSSGYCDISGGTNQSIDPAYGSLTNLQGKGWTIIFNSL